MTGINQGVPETAIGEPIRLGSNNEFEIEQHPVSDRLIIRDTVNGKVAYVRKERGGQIGGDGVLVKALKESKPMADDGRTYDTIQQAERAASSWVFVPPGTFNENVTIDTEGLTLRGSGYNTLIDGASSDAITVDAEDVSVNNFAVQTTGGAADCIVSFSEGSTINSVTVVESTDNGLNFGSKDALVTGCSLNNCSRGILLSEDSIIVNSTVDTTTDFQGIVISSKDNIVSNNIIRNTTGQAIRANNGDNCIISGNRAINAEDFGIFIGGDSNIVANNRVSDSTNADINDNGTGTVLDSNLTGASN